MVVVKINDIQYILNDDYTASVLRFYKYSTTISIPNNILNDKGDSYTVVSINDYAFLDTIGLTSITIPNSITNISKQIFNRINSLIEINVSECNETYSSKDGLLYNKEKTILIKYPEGKKEESLYLNSPEFNRLIEIDNNTFSNAYYLTSITLPDSLTKIAYGAFDNTINLTHFIINNNQHFFTDNGILYDKNQTTLIKYPVGKKEKTLDLSSLQNLRYINVGALNNASNLTSITLPRNLINIDDYVFYDNKKLITININDNDNYSSENGILYDKTKTKLIKYPQGKLLQELNLSSKLNLTSIGNGAFSGASALTSINLPDNLTSIGDWAFNDASALTSINLPDSITSIGYGAFSGASALTSINLPDNLTSIGDWVFSDASALTDINLPDNLTSIGNGTFYGASALTSIDLPNSITSIGDSAFYGASALTSIDLPDNLTSISNNVFNNASALTSITINNNNNYSSEDGILYDRNKTKLIKYPQSKKLELLDLRSKTNLTSIDDNAFNDASSLTSIILPSSISNINDNLFKNIPNLTMISIEDNDNYLSEDGILYNKNKTKLIKFPQAKQLMRLDLSSNKHLISIGNYAFNGVTGLTSITLPNITTIENYIFNGAKSLTEINVSDDNDKYSSEEGILYDKTKTQLIKYPEGKKLNSLDLSSKSNLTSIGNAFIGANNLISITLPANINDIYNYSFQNSINLTEIKVDKNNKYYYSEDGILYNNTKTVLIYYPEGKKTKSLNLSSKLSLNYISPLAFSNTTELKSIVLPNSIISIGYSAFTKATSLRQITLPDNYIIIEQNAFNEATNLEVVIFTNNKKPIIDYNVFNKINNKAIGYYKKSFSWENETIKGLILKEYSEIELKPGIKLILPNQITINIDNLKLIDNDINKSIQIIMENTYPNIQYTLEQINDTLFVYINNQSTDTFKNKEHFTNNFKSVIFEFNTINENFINKLLNIDIDKLKSNTRNKINPLLYIIIIAFLILILIFYILKKRK